MSPSPRRFGLSKSRITAFEQCPKRLWLMVHRPELAEQDEGIIGRFATGHDVGAVACALHPDGVMIEAEPDLRAALDRTRQLIDGGSSGPLFEATFEHDGVLVRVDLLIRSGSGWSVAEVKSSTTPKSYHLGDLATQVWVLREAGIDVQSAVIRHVDRSFVLTREGDYSGLFADAEQLGAIDHVIAARPALVAEARSVLADVEPVREIGDHCSAPFPCEFASYCQRDLPPGPEWPVTVLPHGGGKKWAGQGIADLLDLDCAALPVKQARIVAATRDDAPYHDADGARRVMGKWGWPRAWLDFETIGPAVPRWLGTRPYQQVPFQFSLHLEREDGNITHHEFLSCDGTDPRRACAEALVTKIPQDATIIAYNAGFERGVLRELAQQFPDLAPALEAMAAATVDLLPVAREYWYHRNQRGSWSIKAVLPTLAPLDYGSLEVSHGGEAQEAWLEASHPDTQPDRRAALEQALKVYCAQDTWAMVLIARALSGEAPAETGSA